MTQRTKSVDETAVVAPERVREIMLGIIAGARAGKWTLEGIAAASGVKIDTIKGWIHDRKEPSLSKAFSVAVVLGERSVNALLSVIGYGGATPLDEPGKLDCRELAANAMTHLAVIARAAADGRIDHVEEPQCREAADMLIAEVLPLSSAGKAA